MMTSIRTRAMRWMAGIAGLLVMGAASAAVTNVDLQAVRTNTTLPDGTQVPMWAYCLDTTSTSAISAPTTAGAATGTTCSATTTPAPWAQGPTIVVPTGNSLTVHLFNNLPNVSTSLVIIGQIGTGGGLGSPNKVASPVHSGATSTTFPNAGAANFTPLANPVTGLQQAQPNRARSFSPEAAPGAAVAYTWNALRPGTYLYETGSHPSLQAPMGLYGVLIVTQAPVAANATAATAAQPGIAYGTGTSAVAYDADATFLLSEIDPVQNAQVDAAARAGTSETLLFSDPSCVQQPGGTVACYPAAVNYAATYFLVNGQSYDPTQPWLSTSLIADSAYSTGKVLLRFLNAGNKTHIPTAVGLPMSLVAEDGWVLPGNYKVQNELHLAAGKTGDVLVSPKAVGTAYTDAAYGVFDRQLSLSGGNKPSAGMQAYLGVAPAGTTAASLAAGTVKFSGQSPVSVAAYPDSFTVPATATSVTGNVLANDIGVHSASLCAAAPVAGATTCTSAGGGTVTINADGSTTLTLVSGSVTLSTNGNFTYTPKVSGAVVTQTAESFTYYGNGVSTVYAAAALVATVPKGPPTAGSGSFSSNMQSLLRVNSPGVLAFASDPANLKMMAAGVTQPVAVTGTSGTASVIVNPDGSLLASASAPGSYTFSYTVTDSEGLTAATPGVVTLTFQKGSGIVLNLIGTDGKALPTGTTVAGLPTGQPDYRWIIEQDLTYHTSATGGTVGYTATFTTVTSVTQAGTVLTLTGSTTAPSVLPAVGTSIQLSGLTSTAGAANGIYVVKSVSGSSFTVALPASVTGVKLAAATGAAFFGSPPQSLATNFHTSFMPIVATGCTGPSSCNDAQTTGGVLGAPAYRSFPADVNLPTLDASGNPAVYYISILPGDAAAPLLAPGGTSTGHTMGGAPIAGTQLANAGAALTPVNVTLPPNPVPAGQMSFLAFEDNNPTNGDVDEGEVGLGGWEVVLYDTRGSSGDQAGQITYDVFNQPMYNALVNIVGTATDGTPNVNLCPAAKSAPVGMIYTCLPVLNAAGQDISPYTGMALVKNVIPGRLDVQMHPAAWSEHAGEQWIQVSTLEGTLNNDSFVHPGEPAYWQEFGPPGFHSFIGFINPDHIAAVQKANVAQGAVGTVSGRITGLHFDRPPMATLNDSCGPTGSNTNPACARASMNYTQCYVAINSITGGNTEGPTVAWAPCDPDLGTFKLTGIPDGTYELFVWDEWLDQIKAKQLVQVPDPVSAATATPNRNVSVNDIPVFIWFTRLQESTFLDINGNGVRDPGEPGLTGLPMNVRFRDGTFSNRLITDLNGDADHNELFPLFNWYVLESDTTRFKSTGVHVTYDAGGIPDQTGPYTGLLNSTETFGLPGSLQVPGAYYCSNNSCSDHAVTPTTKTKGAGGTTSRIDPPWVTMEGMQGFINQTELLDWGKQPYAPGENGGIAGMVYFASVRAFDDPRLKVQNLSEPGIPRVTVNLYQESTNPDGTVSRKLVDTTTSLSWDDWVKGTHVDPTNAANSVSNMNCPGNLPTDPFITYTMGPANLFKCYDGQHSFNQVQPAVYDGRYYFPSGSHFANGAATKCSVCTSITQTYPDGTTGIEYVLPAGKYIVEAVPPAGYEITKEEDKNILIGDAWIAAVPQQFNTLSNIFIMPDQATIGNSGMVQLYNTENYGSNFPPCAGRDHIVPDYLTVFPQAQQLAPFAGQHRNLCDKKEVTVVDQAQAVADFQFWTPTPIAAHFTGLMLNDAAAEFDPFNPSFGEKFALPNAPVSIRDYNGVEILRTYNDKWGTFDGLVVSTWEANVPNPSGYSPNMLTTCMNDRGPILDSNPLSPTFNTYVTDPAYDPAYSEFCYNWPFLPGVTTYLDTPVLPVSAFAQHYNPVDCQYPAADPAIARVDGNWTPTAANAASGSVLPASGVGPYLDLAKATGTSLSVPLTITARGDVQVLNPNYVGPTGLTAGSNTMFITRHYGFGTTAGTVSIGGIALPASAIASWTDAKIVVNVPVIKVAGKLSSEYRTGELVVTTAAGRASVDAATVTIENSAAAGYVSPYYVAAPAPTNTVANALGTPHPIQDAIDLARPGQMIIVDAGQYPELAIMWKPVRLQGVGAASTVINATKFPNTKLQNWRDRINVLFGLDYMGNQITSATGTILPSQVDPLPGQEITGGVVLLEPSVLATEEGAGITVLASSTSVAAAACPTGSVAVPNPFSGVIPLNSTATPTVSPVAGSTPGNARLQVDAYTPVAATTASRGFSNFSCAASRIDGIGITGSDSGGGIYVNGWASNLEIANTRVYGNAGQFNGGIRVGQPYLEGEVQGSDGYLHYNDNVSLHNNAVYQNGTVEANAAPGVPVGTSGVGGGISVNAGSDNFSVANNWVCGNYTSGDGAGIGVLGLSQNGRVSSNMVIFNEAYEQTGPNFGGGIAVEGETGTGNTGTSLGVGAIQIDGNLIQGNFARAGSGGGIRISDASGDDLIQHAFTGQPYVQTISNNFIVNNLAGWAGGGISLVDSPKLVIVNNTVSNNDSLGIVASLFNTVVAGKSTGPATGVPSPAGIADEPNSPVFAQAVNNSGNGNGSKNSNPVITDDVIWHNRSFFFTTRQALGTSAAAQTANSNAQTFLCASNAWTDATSGNCTQLAPQATTGACDTTNAKYWDVGSIIDTSATPSNQAAPAVKAAIASQSVTASKATVASPGLLTFHDVTTYTVSLTLNLPANSAPVLVGGQVTVNTAWAAGATTIIGTGANPTFNAVAAAALNGVHTVTSAGAVSPGTNGVLTQTITYNATYTGANYTILLLLPIGEPVLPATPVAATPVGTATVAGQSQRLYPTYSVLSNTAGYTTLSNGTTASNNNANDPLFTKGYCNGSRITPGLQFEPGSPFQPAFTLQSGATLDESGNFVDVHFGPLSLRDPASTFTTSTTGAVTNAGNLVGDYHLSGKSGGAYNLGSNLTATYAGTAHDIDLQARPANPARGAITATATGVDIGADEYYGTATTTTGSVTLSPASLAYGSALVGSTNDVQYLTLNNATGAAITYTPSSTAGSNWLVATGPFTATGGAALGGIACGTGSGVVYTLAAGASCQIKVTFAPTAAGYVTGTLTATVSTGDVTPVVTMEGTGVAAQAALTIAPKPDSWSTERNGAATASATNSGPSVRYYTVTNPAANVDALQLNGATTAYATGLAGTTSVIGTFTVGGAVPTGSTLTPCVTSGATATVLAPGSSCGLSVSFSASWAISIGSASSAAVLSLAANDVSLDIPAAAPTATDTLTATLVIPTASNSGTTALGSVPVNGTASTTITVKNTAAAAMGFYATLSNVNTAGNVNNGFSIGSASTCAVSAPVASNGTCTVVVNWAPTTAGTLATVFPPTLTISGNGLVASTSTFSGTATTSVIAITDTSSTGLKTGLGSNILPFVLGTASATTTSTTGQLTLTNSGNDAFVLSSIGTLVKVGTTGNATVQLLTTGTCNLNGTLATIPAKVGTTNGSCTLNFTVTAPNPATSSIYDFTVTGYNKGAVATSATSTTVYVSGQ